MKMCIWLRDMGAILNCGGKGGQACPQCHQAIHTKTGKNEKTLIKNLNEIKLKGLDFLETSQ